MGTETRINADGESPISAIGVIVPVAWDADGNPVEVALFAEDEAAYRIDPETDAGRALGTLSRERVQVVGLSRRAGTDGRRLLLRVSRYHLLPP